VSVNETTITVAGCIMQDDIPPEDYRDCLSMELGLEDVRYMLKMGHFPPGLLLQDHTGKYMVVGVYESPQKLMRFIV
jgi:hypothetical protein